jgi:hypothetical protein
MLRRIGAAVLLVSLSAWPAGLTLDQVTALAKTYFRDSAEVPMSVAVNTVVTDKAGKVTYRGQSTVSMVFHGYNQSSGHWSFRGNSGWFNTGALRDSVSGEIGAFMAASLLTPQKDDKREREIREPAQVVIRNSQCAAFVPMKRWLFPQNFCGTLEASLSPEAGSDWMFQHIQLESAGLPAPARISYLGDVKLQSFRVDVDFQKAMLPGDPKPYLWPQQTVATARTDKGTVTITNRYSARK